MSPTRKSSRYSPHPSIAFARSVVAGMKAKTGRSLEEWISFVNAKGPKSEEARRGWLKQGHGLGTNYAGWIAGRSLGKGAEDTDPEAYLRVTQTYVAAQYPEAKAALRPIYAKVLALGRVSAGRHKHLLVIDGPAMPSPNDSRPHLGCGRSPALRVVPARDSSRACRANRTLGVEGATG